MPASVSFAISILHRDQHPVEAVPGYHNDCGSCSIPNLFEIGQQAITSYRLEQEALVAGRCPLPSLQAPPRQ